MRHVRLRSFLSVSVVTLAAVLTAVIGGIVSEYFGRGIRTEIGQSLAQAADGLQTKLDAEIFERVRDIEMAAASGVFGHGHAPISHMRDYLTDLQTTYQSYAWIGFATLNGTVQIATGGLLEGVSVAERSWFRQASTSLQRSVTLDVHEAKLLATLLPVTQDEPLRLFDIAAIVREDAGKSVGVLGAHLTWAWARKVENAFLAQMRQHRHLDTFIVDKEGKVLLGPKPYVDTYLDLKSLNINPYAANGYAVSTWSDGSRYVGGYAKSQGYGTYPGMGWSIIIRQNLQEAYIPLYSIQQKVLWIGALFCLMFAACGILLSRRIARPLNAIAEAADKIRQGQLHTDIPASSHFSEVFRLAQALQAMLKNQRQAEQALKDLNQSLEQQVQDRTHALSESQRKTATILMKLSDGVATLDRTGAILSANPAFCTLFGYAPQKMLGQNIQRFVPDLADGAGKGVSNATPDARHPLAAQNIDIAGNHIWGIPLFVDLTITPFEEADGSDYFICVVHDITQRKLAEQRQQSHDVLTGLFNRREFERHLSECLHATGCQTEPSMLIYLDVDQFKIVNDLSGRVAGDELLKALGNFLQTQLHQDDVLARLGGDEFAILLPHSSLPNAVAVAERLRAGIAQLGFSWSDRSFLISASMGIVGIGSDFSKASAVLAAGEAACYMAKEKGRNRIQVFHAQQEEFLSRLNEMDWVSRIHQALQHNRFCLYAQKIAPVHPSPHLHSHYELLVRLRDDQGKLIAPGFFIPAAERYDLMPLIDRWVISQAFAVMARARAAGDATLEFAINLSGTSLRDESLLPYIREQFSAHDIPRQCISFEVTETAAVENLARANLLIQALRADGSKFALDDFGSGMSSFAYLKNMTIDFLKIDGCFVKDICTNSIDYTMVRSIHEVANAMGVRTIAEYVEDDATLSKLGMIGIDYAQGYGVAKPVPIEEIVLITPLKTMLSI